MIGVIIKKDGIVIDKRVLDGDDDKNLVNLIDEQSKNKDKEFIVYHEGEWADFEKTEVPVTKTPEQLQWDAVKTTASPTEKMFAKALGFDV